MNRILATAVAVVATLGVLSLAFAQGTTSSPSGTTTPESGTPSTAPDLGKAAPEPGKTVPGTVPVPAPGTTKPGTAGKPATGKAMGKSTANSKGMNQFRGRHAMIGEVTRIDAAKGSLTLKTEDGELDLHFPPTALSGIKEGNRVEVQLAVRPAGNAGKTGASKPSAMPKTKAPSS